MMKDFFAAIQSLFVDFLFAPFDFLRGLELKSWWGANIINWIFVITCVYWAVYWIKQIQLFKNTGEDVQDTTAHSFLK